MNKKSISKFLSLILRHDPSKAGLSLDENGWVQVDTLLAGLNRAGKTITFEDLKQVVETNDKKRFAFSDDHKKIRASQGHSIDIDLALEPIKPPERLYHGTASRNLRSIMKQGLTPQSRQHVHLSIDHETAVKVGFRHGASVVLSVNAGDMDIAGIEFFRSANGVWLTKNVDSKYLSHMGS